MKKTFSANEEKITLFFLISACALGASVRVYPLLMNDFPLADGGMFYAMITDLQASHFSLPELTSYNLADIPFAYPPLGFYIADLLNSFMGVSVLNILRWLPAIITVLNIPLYYYFARQVTNSAPKAALAAFIFTLTPGSYWWNIVGGGLTRSLGVLFFTAAAASIHQMYQTRTRKWIVLSILSSVGVILSHPIWSLETAVAAIALWMFFGRDRQGFLYSVIVAASVLLVTAPWWGLVVYSHGIGVFVNATKNAFSYLQALAILITLAFTSEQTPIIALLGVFGFFIHSAQRKFFLPAWIILCFLVEPRGGSAASLFPFSILAATTLADAILPRLTSLPNAVIEWTDAIRQRPGQLFFGFLTLIFLYNALQMSSTVAARVLSWEERAAIEWVKTNTSPNSRFLILDKYDNPVYSPLTEWFPALAKRRSIATIQGTEWLPDKANFVQRFHAIEGVHYCLFQNVECIDQFQPHLPGGAYDYILLSVKDARTPLLEDLNADKKFTPVYSSTPVYIFRTNR